MPVEGESRHQALRREIQGKLVGQIRASSNNHTVALKGSDFSGCDQDWVAKGEYPIEVLAKANSVYHVDRVLFLRVNQWQPFEPMELAITFHLVDSREAKLLVSEDQHWSLQDPLVKEAYRRYLCERFRCKGNVEIYFRCPTYFCDFVTQRISDMSK